MKSCGTLIAVVLISLTIEANIQNSDEKTKKVLAYINHLIDKQIVKTESLEKIFKTNRLCNPISEKEAYSSHTAFIHWKQLNKMIAATTSDPNSTSLQTWYKDTMNHYQLQNQLRLLAHKRTENLYYPMAFKAVPPGTYISAINQVPFTIHDGFELQETPVTEYQWASVMLKMPMKFHASPYGEEVTIDNHTFTIHPNCPVGFTCLSAIEQFLTKLNQKDDGYTYILPSTTEYEACLQTESGISWPHQIELYHNCVSQQETCPLTPYSFDTSQTQIGKTIGNVWEFTRDLISAPTKNGKTAHGQVLFGTSCNTVKKTTDIKNVLRPIFFKNSSGYSIGFRVLRHKKNAQLAQNSFLMQPDLNTVNRDNEWQWDDDLELLIHKDDRLRFMTHYKDMYSSQTLLHTLAKLLSLVGSNDPTHYLRELKKLTLSSHLISDLRPIGLLEQLEHLNVCSNKIRECTALHPLKELKILKLASNNIEDITPLAALMNLQELDLAHNNIEDISALTALTHLTKLDVAHNPIKNFAPLTALANLTILFISKDQNETLIPIKKMIPKVQITQTN